MEPPTSLLPDQETLAAGLTAVLTDSPRPRGPVEILDRWPNQYGRQARSEIVTCRLEEGGELRLFCKYEARDRQWWSDVAYEAEVYRHVLQPAPVSTLAFYGSYAEPVNGRTWLVLEYLDGGVSLGDFERTTTMRLAARWLGRFHAFNDARLRAAPMPFLKVYDLAFYLRYVARAVQFASGNVEASTWLPTVGRWFEAFVAPVLAARPTVTHSDYHADNVMLRHGMVYPIDWEMAGIDLGETDLVYLLEAWPEELQQGCLDEYRGARWPDGEPAEFSRFLDAARLCLYFYKLGGCPDWTKDRQCLWYCRRLRALAARLELS